MIRNFVKKLQCIRHDPHMLEIFQGAIVAFVLKVVGAGLMFGFNVLIARLLGAEGTGLYFIAFAVMAICTVFSRLGLDNVLLRFIATCSTTGDWERAQAVYVLGMKMALISSSVMTVILFFLAPWLATLLFNKPELAEPLRWMSLTILPFTILNLQAESLKGLKCIRDAMLVQGVGLPLLALLFVFPLITWSSSNLIGVVTAYLLGSIAMVILGAWRWRVNMPDDILVGVFSFKVLWESCKPLLVVALMNRALMPWAPILLLGIWASTGEVAVFGVATKVVLLVSFMLMTINTIVAPKFAELYAKEDMQSLGEVARRTTMLITVLVSPVFLILFFYGDWVLLLFGSQFTVGANMLAILTVGQLINVLCGSVGYLLIMSGNEKIYRNITMFSVCLQLLLTVILAPLWGGIGVAIAASISVVVMNLAAVYAVYKKLGIMMFYFVLRK